MALPLLAMLALLMIQVGLVLRAQVMTVHAAREAARVVAVSNDPGQAASAVVSSSGFDAASVEVVVSGSAEPGTDVSVSVEHDFATEVPLVGSLLGNVTLTARVAMRAEG
jgi:hypothetical protein